MTHFEFISIAVSIILGLGVIQLLSNLDQVVDGRRRYWLHTLWVFYFFWLLLQNWWAFWDFRNVDWDIAKFSFWITFVGIMYVMALTLVKSQSSSTPWKEHYFTHSRRFFGLFLLLMVSAITISVWLVDAPLLHPYRIVQTTMLLIVLVLLVSKNQRVHEVLGPISTVILFVGQLVFRLNPGLFSAGS